MPKYEKVSLETICDGAAAEVFAKCLGEVMQNIHDPNTDPDQARAIALVFKLKPSNDRTMAEISFSCQAKVMPIRTVKGSIIMARENGQLNAYSCVAKQEPLFPTAEAATEQSLTQ